MIGGGVLRGRSMLGMVLCRPGGLTGLGILSRGVSGGGMKQFQSGICRCSGSLDVVSRERLGNETTGRMGLVCIQGAVS